MLFNSFEFLLFFLIFLALYLPLRTDLRKRNLLILIASYVFYGWWDWRFLSLIVISSTVDYAVGLALERAEASTRRKQLLGVSLLVNLGALGFFKYFDFFVDSMAAALSSIGFHPNTPSLHIILPVGISFYTFQTLSYTIDIYRRKIEATHDPLAFFAFVAFFPQLVAGPIERASRLLPQFLEQRPISGRDVELGTRQVAWGLFKKIVVADNCAAFVDIIFGDPGRFSSSTLILGAFLFAFQIYGDFSGYSDMAIGLARILGFKLMKNFRQPYFSANIQEFWRRWHISLSTWFRDYLFIPLGGSRVRSAWLKYRNIFITFTVSGLWHGANWQFIVWGALHSFYYMIYTAFRGGKTETAAATSPLTRWANTALVFAAVVFAWIFFRAETISDALAYIGRIFTTSLIANPVAEVWLQGGRPSHLYLALAMILVLIAIEILAFDRDEDFSLGFLSTWARSGVYAVVVFSLFIFRDTGESLDFIYFQF